MDHTTHIQTIPPTPEPTPTAPAAAPPPAEPASPKPFPVKLLFIIGSSVIALIAIVLVAFLVIIPMFSVSASDYRDAYDAYSDVRSNIRAIEGKTSYIDTNTTETEIENDSESLRKALDSYRASVTKLGEARAITRDSQAKSLHAALQSKLDKLTSLSDITLDAYDTILPPLAKFIRGTDSYTSDYNGLLNQIADFKNSFVQMTPSHQLNKDFVAAMVDVIGQYETALRAYVRAAEAYQRDWRNNPYPSSSSVYDAQNKINDAINDWQSNLETAAEDADPSHELDELSNYLLDKTLVN
jgi:tetratricopeptide (TPR) repeat protein